MSDLLISIFIANDCFILCYVMLRFRLRLSFEKSENRCLISSYYYGTIIIYIKTY